jgi:signal transduction histidine kinase
LTIWLSVAGMGSLFVFAGLTAIVIHLDERNEAGADPFEAVRQALIAMAVAAPVGLAFATACAYFLTRRALAPVEDVIRSAGAMSGADLSLRLPQPTDAGIEEELRPLVAAFNGLLQRIEETSAASHRFAAEASHELRTPLAVIASRIEVELRRPRSAEEWERTSAEVLGEVRRLGSLVDSLLKLARGEASTRVSRIDLRPLIESAIASYRPLAEERSVSVDLSKGETDRYLRVNGDADMLTSAFTNLLENAIRHSPPNGSVQVILERGAGRVAVHVDDSGPGVTEEDGSRIFRPFERGPDAPEEAHEGIGLGLAIARRIVEKHGGSVAARRSDAGGARFTISLPLEA